MTFKPKRFIIKSVGTHRNKTREANKMKKINVEEIIINSLMERGFSRSEASREAFLYIEAWKNGEVEPETMRSLGVEV